MQHKGPQVNQTIYRRFFKHVGVILLHLKGYKYYSFETEEYIFLIIVLIVFGHPDFTHVT